MAKWSEDITAYPVPGHSVEAVQQMSKGTALQNLGSRRISTGSAKPQKPEEDAQKRASPKHSSGQ